MPPTATLEDIKAYQQALVVDRSAPGYPQNGAALAPSTIQRWISALGRFNQTCRTALILLLQENSSSSICRDLARLVIVQQKYKTNQRKKQLNNYLKKCMGSVYLVPPYTDILIRPMLYPHQTWCASQKGSQTMDTQSPK